MQTQIQSLISDSIRYGMDPLDAVRHVRDVLVRHFGVDRSVATDAVKRAALDAIR